MATGRVSSGSLRVVSWRAKPKLPTMRLWPAAALLPALVAGSVPKPAGILTVLGLDTTVFALGILLIAAARESLRRPHYPLKELLPFLLFAAIVVFGVARSEFGEYQTLKARDFFFVTGVIVACIPLLLRDLRDLRGLAFIWLLAGSVAAGTVLLVGGSDDLYGRAGIGESTLGPAYLAELGLS